LGRLGRAAQRWARGWARFVLGDVVVGDRGKHTVNLWLVDIWRERIVLGECAELAPCLGHGVRERVSFPLFAQTAGNLAW
jgi:hypothetical protein